MWYIAGFFTGYLITKMMSKTELEDKELDYLLPIGVCLIAIVLTISIFFILNWEVEIPFSLEPKKQEKCDLCEDLETLKGFYKK